MSNIKESDSWTSAVNEWIRIHDVLVFIRENYGVDYAENSRETFRKQAMHHFRNAAFIEDNGKATNSPNYRYRLTNEMLGLIQSYVTEAWEGKKNRFLANHESLMSIYASKRSMQKMPVIINGADLPFLQANTMNCKRLLLKNSHHGLHRVLNVYTLVILRKKTS